MGKRIFIVVSVLSCLALSVGRSEALSVLVSRAAGSGIDWGYGVGGWSGVTALLDEATGGNVAVVDGFEDLAQMLDYDALWLDARYSFPAPVRLTALEIANIQAFVGTGRRVVLFGENMDFFGGWDESVLAVVGGTLESVRLNTPVAGVPGHELTDGVQSVAPVMAGVAGGGTPLFEQNFATTWGANVVTVLDVSLFSDANLGQHDNAVFADNLVRWVAASPPPPDADGDGFTEDQGDCNDSDASIHPGAAEVCFDGVDQDCDGGEPDICIVEHYRDADRDGYGDPSDWYIGYSPPPEGYVLNGDDCDDTSGSIHPGAVEVCGDGIDQDCSGGDRPCDPATDAHSCDYNPADWALNLSELLRTIQLYNSDEYSCGDGTEDGYTPGTGDRTCTPHASDYRPRDWSLDLSELLRAIQFYNSGGYHPDPAGEDGFAPGP